METAWQTASLARFEAERLQGDIKWRLNNFAQAEIYHTGALAALIMFEQAADLFEGLDLPQEVTRSRTLWERASR